MEHILPAYKDPLFSIMLILVIALIIALVTYGWGIHKEYKEEGNLLKFLEKFDSSECSLNTSDMVFEPNMLKPLSLLAQAFENVGEYHKSINIYLYLIKHIKYEVAQIELMERLGNTYLHAGFLERSKSIYLEILRKRPRNPQILYELGIVYEILHEYDRAKEILEPLQILGEDISSLEKFWEYSSLSYDKKIDKKLKIIKLKKLLEDEPKLYRAVFKSLLALDINSAWRVINLEKIEEILDILWFLPYSQLDLDIITSNAKLEILYYAKGYLQKATIDNDVDNSIFSLNLLATAKQNGFEDGDLIFSYLCQKCKQSFPVSFNRCPSCMAIHSIKVEEKIAKLTPKTEYSLL